jgi:hypothetical protein
MAKFIALALLLCVASARAEDRLTTLERELDLYAEQTRRERIGDGILSLALGATLLPAGIVMTKRDNPTVHLIGIGTIVTGAVQLARLPELISPSDMERMRLRHQRRTAEGLRGEALVAETERDWREKAAKEHRVQRLIGAINLGIGAAALPIGIAFMLRDQIGDMDHRKQLNVGSTMLGIGVGYVTSAAVMLFHDGATERSWKSHAVSLGLAPTLAGAALTASGRF